MQYLTEFAFAFGRIIATRLAGASRAILANIAVLEGKETGQEDGSANEPLFGQIGFFGRPLAPVKAADATGLKPKGEAEVFAVRVGDQVQPLAGRDLRLNAKVNPKDGEFGIVQYAGGFISIGFDEAGAGKGTTLVMYAPRNNDAGVPTAAHDFQMDTTPGNESITLMHLQGHNIALTHQGKILLQAAAASFIEVNSAKILLNAAEVVMAGGALLGTSNPASADFLVKYTAFAAWAATVTAAVNAMAAAFNAVPAGMPVLAVPVTPAGGAAVPTTLTKAT